MPYQDLKDMTKEQRLLLGARLIEKKNELEGSVYKLKSNNLVHPANVDDVELRCSFGSITATGGPLCAADADAYTKEMRDAALGRCERLRAFCLEIAEERLKEIQQTLEDI